MAQEAGMTAQQYAKFQHGLNGSGSAVVNPPGDRKPGSGDQSGSFDLNKAAKSVGLSTGTIQYSGGRLLDGDESAHDADVIRGTDDMVADHIRENYNINNTGLMDRNGNVDETATEDYNAAMANTMRLGPSIVAEDVLFGADKTLEGNDELGAAAIEGAFGDNLRLDTAGGANGEGRLQDIKAETAPIQRTRDGQVISGGGRVVSGTYVAPVRDSNGNVMQKNGKDMTYQAELTIMDDVAYSQLNAQAQQQMEMVQSKSGGTYYVRRAEIQQNKVRNSSKRSEQREKASERFRRRGGRKSDRDD